MPRHQNQIKALRQIVLQSTVCFTQQPLLPISFDGVAVLFGHAHSDSAALVFITNNEYQQMIVARTNAIVAATKVTTAADTLFLRQEQWFELTQGIILSMPQGRLR